MRKHSIIRFALIFMVVFTGIFMTAVWGTPAGGLVWSDNIMITNSSSLAMRPAIALDSSRNIHIVWLDNRIGHYELYYTKLNNTGSKKLVNETRLTYSSANNSNPANVWIEPDSNENIHVTWSDNRTGQEQVYYMKLDNNGTNLTGEIPITNNHSAKSNNPPWIDVDSDDSVHILWRTCTREPCGRYGEGYDLYYAKLNNSGAKLTNNTRLTFNSTLCCGKLKVDSDGNPHIAFDDKRTGNLEIYYMKLNGSTGAGGKIIEDTRLTFNGTYSCCPNIAVDSHDNVHITWFDDRHREDLPPYNKHHYTEIYYIKLNNTGGILVNETRLTNNTPRSEDPRNAIDPYGNLHVTIWQHASSPTAWPNEIYYMKLDNNGNIIDYKWLSDTKDTKHRTARIAVDSDGNDYVAWTASNSTASPCGSPCWIYFKRSFVTHGITITSPQNTITDNTPDLNLTTDELANITYSWDGQGNISGCRNCDSYNTTYGEHDGSNINLTALWHVNENYGTMVYDDSTNSNDGTLIGGPTFVSGKYGKGIEFDGTDDYINISANSPLNLRDNDNPHTVLAWFKVNQIGVTYTVISQANGIGIGLNWIMIPDWADSDGRWSKNEIVTVLPDSTVARSNVIVAPDTWYFAAVVYNGSDMVVYVDGNAGEAVTTTVDEGADGDIHIGTNKKASGGWFNGTIDEVMLFDRNLSVAEIQVIYSKTLSAGQHNVTVYATDTAGNSNSTTRWFKVGTTLIDITSPQNATSPDNTPYLKFTIAETSNTTYSWDGEGNISGCRNCISHNTTYGESVPEANTSLLLHFNENFGDMAYDDSASGNNGTLIGGPTPVAGKFGYGLNFNGSDDYVNLSYDPSLDVLDGDSPFTLAMWVKFDKLPSEVGNKQVLFSQAGGMGTGRNWLVVENTNNNFTSALGGVLYDSGIPAVANEWQFVVLHYNGTSIQIFVDNTLGVVDTRTVDENANGDYRIGVRWQADLKWFNGTIDEVTIYNRSLSTAEIQELYNKSLSDGAHNVIVYASDSSGNLSSTTGWFTVDTTPPTVNITSPQNTITDTTPDLNMAVDEPSNITYSFDSEGSITGCQNCTSYSTTYGEATPDANTAVLLMHFNENFGDTAFDDSTNNNDASLGSGTAGTKPNWTNNGKFGPALNFDGIDDEVGVPYSDSLNITKELTVMFWFRLNGSNAGDKNQYLVSQGMAAYTNYRWAILFNKNTGSTRGWVCTMAGSCDNSAFSMITTPDDTIQFNRWYFAALTYNSSDSSMSLYINGTLMGTKLHGTGGDIKNDASDPVQIGERFQENKLHPNGTIDEVHILNRALNASEIANVYHKNLLNGSHNVTVYASDTAGNMQPSTAWFIINKYRIPLNLGWNQISIPLEQDDWNITSVLASIEGNYDVVYAYIDGVWKFTTSRNPLTEMDLEHGYRINMTAPDTLEISGAVPSVTTITVNPGTNLVGYPSLATREISTVLSPINYSVVYAYIDGVWKFTTAHRNPLTEVSPGYGYWIYANETGSYEIRN